MSISYSAETLAKLTSYKPPIHLSVEIIKNYGGTPTTIDVTNRLQSLGTYSNSATNLQLDWVIPSLTPTLINTGGYFDRDYATSIWNQSPAKAPEDCVLRVTCSMKKNDGSLETLWKYIGRIQDISFKGNKDFSICELVTVFEQAAPNKLGKLFTRRDGPYSHYYSSTEWRSWPYTGSICMDPPNIITDVGFSTGSPYPYYKFLMSDLHNCFLHLWEKRSSSPVEYLHLETHVPNDNRMILPASSDVRCRWITAEMDPYNWDNWFYNPIAYDDYNPAEIIQDIIDKIVSMPSELWDSSSFSAMNTLFAGLTYEPLMEYAIINKTGIEAILEILSHVPWTVLFNSYLNKLTYKRWPDWDDEPSPFEISSAKKNFNRIITSRNNESRLITDIDVYYDPRIDELFFHLDRVPTLMLNYQATTPYSKTKDRQSRVERPGWSKYITNYTDMIAAQVNTQLYVSSKPIPELQIACPITCLSVELLDIVLLDIPEWKISQKKLLVVGKDIDMDGMEIVFTLFDQNLYWS